MPLQNLIGLFEVSVMRYPPLLLLPGPAVAIKQKTAIKVEHPLYPYVRADVGGSSSLTRLGFVLACVSTGPCFVPACSAYSACSDLLILGGLSGENRWREQTESVSSILCQCLIGQSTGYVL